MRTIPTYRTGSKAHRIASALLDELEADDLVTTSRLLYYRLVARGVIGKELKRDAGHVTEQLTRLRRLGIVPYWRIVDRTRATIDPDVWPSLADAVAYTVEHARLDPWLEEMARPVVMVESESLAGVLESNVHKYAVPVVPLRGLASESFLWDVARRLYEPVPIRTTFYLGDWDKTGHEIEADVRDRLDGFAPDCWNMWERLAVTDEQVDGLQLPVVEKYHNRTRSRHPAVETEALGRGLIMSLTTDALEAHCAAAVQARTRRADPEGDEARERARLTT